MNFVYFAVYICYINFLIMKLPESIAIVMLFMGLYLLFSGLSQSGSEITTMMVEGKEVAINNSAGINMNIRVFLGIVSLIGAVVATIVGGGLTTVRKAGIEPSSH